ncbi:Flp family type IVb pilin [Mesorhizobium sp. KR2-14]|uniref:Flp family type IVb pilin n=1 Tax=Mesorhizobium sp. KR2-14 TaxID=3156610 RepID=UPI0032B366D4
MNKIMNIARRFREEEDGAAMVEYSILVGIITAAAIGLIIGVGGYVKDAWQDLCTNIGRTGAGCTKA